MVCDKNNRELENIIQVQMEQFSSTGLYCSLGSVLEIGGSIFGCHSYGGEFLIFSRWEPAMVNVLECAECSCIWKDYPMSWMTYRYPRHSCGWNTYLKLYNLHINFFPQNFIIHWIFQEYNYHGSSVKTVFCLELNQELFTITEKQCWQQQCLWYSHLQNWKSKPFFHVTFMCNRENKRSFWTDLE